MELVSGPSGQIAYARDVSVKGRARLAHLAANRHHTDWDQSWRGLNLTKRLFPLLRSGFLQNGFPVTCPIRPGGLK